MMYAVSLKTNQKKKCLKNLDSCVFYLPPAGTTRNSLAWEGGLGTGEGQVVSTVVRVMEIQAHLVYLVLLEEGRVVAHKLTF